MRDVLQPIQRGKRDRTVSSAYKRLAPGVDGRIHTGLSVGTTSMRLASAETITEDASTNLQNQVNKIASLDPLYETRAVMMADPGMCLCSRDYAGAEMLLAFAYAKDWEWVELLINGAKAHAIHAIEAFGLKCKPEEVKSKFPQVYTTSKNLGFLSLYSGSARTATVTFNKDYPIHGQRITEKEAGRFQEVLYDLHPLRRWWSDVGDLIEAAGGFVTNCFGYTRPLRDPDKHNRLKDALSFYPQSTVAWKMNETIITVHDELDREGEIELLHQNHDELDWQAVPECLDESLRFTKATMESPFKIHGRELYIPTEVKVGQPGGAWNDLEVRKAA